MNRDKLHGMLPPIATIGLSLAATGLKIFGHENHLLEFAAHPLELLTGHVLAERAHELMQRVHSFQRVTNEDLDRAIATSVLYANQLCLLDALPPDAALTGPLYHLRRRLKTVFSEPPLLNVIAQVEELEVHAAFHASSKLMPALEGGQFHAFSINPVSLVQPETGGNIGVTLAAECFASIHRQHPNLPSCVGEIFQKRWFLYLCLAFQDQIKTKERVSRIFQAVQTATGFTTIESVVREEAERSRNETQRYLESTNKLLAGLQLPRTSSPTLPGEANEALHNVESRITLLEENGELSASATERLTIGRNPTNTLAIADDVVSWEHGEIVLRGGTFCYRHLSSRNSAVLRRRGEDFLFRPGKQSERNLFPYDKLIIGCRTFIVKLTLAVPPSQYVTTKDPEEQG